MKFEISLKIYILLKNKILNYFKLFVYLFFILKVEVWSFRQKIIQLNIDIED